MPDDITQLKKRLDELARRAFAQQRYAYSEFLTLDEQDVLLSLKLDAGAAPFSLHGGFDAAERRIAQFGDEALCGYAEAPPVRCVAIAPLSQKFADVLSHRDFLGALMSLGVRRSVLGDILLNENIGYLFCLDTIADFIVREFGQVKHTSVRCETIDSLPDFAVRAPESRSVNVASERLDAMLAAVYKLSRGESQELIAQGKVYLNGRLTENASREPAPGDIVSVRGFGRFIFEGVAKETKKGRLFVDVRVY